MSSGEYKLASSKDEARHLVEQAIRAVGLRPEETLGRYPHQLSGGQRQRIAIARVLLKNAPILILDEATSSLDVRSEEKVQNAIERVISNCTGIIIAHRLSTVIRADKIAVLKNGELETIGKHQELIRSNEVYQELYKSQFESGREIAE